MQTVQSILKASIQPEQPALTNYSPIQKNGEKYFDCFISQTILLRTFYNLFCSCDITLAGVKGQGKIKTAPR